MTAPQHITRRGVLQILGLSTAGAAGVGALAGCSPAKPTGTGSGTTEFHGGWPYKAPPEGNFNMLSPSAIINGAGAIYGDLINLPSAFFLWAQKTWVNALVDEFKLDGAANTYTIKVKSGLKWSDDKPLTSADYATTFYCQYIMCSPMWTYIKSVETPDDTTVLLHLKNPSTVLERYLLKMRVMPTQDYGPWADKAKAIVTGGKTMDDSAGTALSTDFQKFQPKQYIASGPFNLDYNAISNTQVSFVKNPKGAFADTTKFDKVVVYNGETAEITPLVQSKDVDYATHGFPSSSEKAFASAGFRILRPPNYSGPALLFNLAKLPEFKDKRARQAIAHVIDRDVAGAVALGDSGKGVKAMTGMSDNQVNDWLTADQLGKLDKYELSPQKATSLLQAAGWKKEGSAWKKPDGSAAAYELAFPSQFADWSGAAKSVADQLTQFGIKVTPRGVDQTQQPIDVDKGNFQLAIQGWGSTTQPHPFFAFVQALYTHNIPVAANNGGKGMDFELQNVQTTDYGTVDLKKLVDASGVGLDAASQKAAVSKVAIIFNELLPLIPLLERYGNNPALEGKRVQKFPADDDPILKNPAYADNFTVMWLMQGKLLPVTS
ncbi:MAG: ABC transporter substrate-binding protein [Propionibacteriaceae bacterium]